VIARRAIGVGLVAISLAGTAAAGPTREAMPPPPGVDQGPAAAIVSNIIYLNRCKDGCTYHAAATSNSRLDQTYLGGGQIGDIYVIPPCTDPSRMNAPTCDDAWWADVVACVTADYAPYDVIVTDVDPGTVTPHHEAVAAGVQDNWQFPPTVGGRGPLDVANGCPVREDTVSISLDVWGFDVREMCSTIAQESGHGFGIEHTSNCQDPMGAGYVFPRCGEYFFRNETLPCADGMGQPTDCFCGGSMQNVHNELLGVFGANAVPLPSPVVTLGNPSDGATFPAGNEFTIAATGALDRGIGRAEVWFNGYKWLEQNAMRNQTGFSFTAPPDLPDGVIDVEVRVFNDLETVYGTGTATVTKGAPCADESSCAAGQHCDTGRCAWDEPGGQLGDACDYPQFCVSGQCEASQCTQDCQTGIDGFCPAGLTCVGNGDGTNGYCLTDTPEEPGGCCSTGSSTPTAMLLGQLGLVGLVLGGILRRRRPRRA
jgi:hypothetical protein